MGRDGRSTVMLGIVLLIAMRPATSRAAPADSASAARGIALFSGAVPLQNGGPACGTCHNLAGLAFPFGGSLGPELGQSYARLGERGTRSALATLFFPSMVTPFAGKPLTAAEQADLLSALSVAPGNPPASATSSLALSATCGALAALLFTVLFGRKRLTGVRRRILQRSLSSREVR